MLKPRIHPLAVMAIFVVLSLSTGSGLWAQDKGPPQGDEPGKFDPIIPLPIGCAHPGIAGMTFSRETRLSKMPGCNHLERVVAAINKELKGNCKAVMIAQAKAAGANDPDGIANLSYFLRHVLTPSTSAGSNRDTTEIGWGVTDLDGVVERQSWMRQGKPSVVMYLKLHEELIWSNEFARAFCITGSCAVHRTQAATSSRRDTPAPDHGYVTRVRYEHCLGRFKKLGEFGLTVEAGLTCFCQKGWLLSVDWHLKIGLEWFEMYGFCVNWEIDLLKTTFTRRTKLSY